MDNQVIYIPEYVEQGVAKLQEAKSTLEEITAQIEAGIATINGSGYNRGIPHIEKGDTVSTALGQMKSTIATITSQIEKYSNGEALELENAIIIADPATISKYGLTVSDIDYTLSDYLFGSNVSGKWSKDYLTASAGFIKYVTSGGRMAKETWCDLNPNNLAKLMKEQGFDLDFWIREDGGYMYGDYVMVAADIPHMDGTEQAAEYRKGDLVETSLGTGIVVDLCGMAEDVRKGKIGGADSDVGVWYDIYTAWHDGGRYQQVGYCEDPNCSSCLNCPRTMIKESTNSSTREVNTATLAGTGVSGKSTTQFRLSEEDENAKKEEQSTETPTTAKTETPTTAKTETPTTARTEAPTTARTEAPTTGNNGNSSNSNSGGSSSSNGSSGSNYGGSSASSGSSGSNYGGSSGSGYKPPSTTPPKIDPTKPEILEIETAPPTIATTPPTQVTQPQQNWNPPTQAPQTQPIQQPSVETTPTIVNPTPEQPTIIVNNNSNVVEQIYIPTDKNIQPTTEVITTENTKKSINPVSLVAGATAAIIAGASTKAIIDNKEETKEKKEQKEETTKDEDSDRIMEIGAVY